MKAFLTRFARDRRGVSAVEFALIAPVMITFYMGMTEFTQASMADRRNAHVASAVGDLVAQSSQVTNSDLTDIFNIGHTIMEPFPDASLKIRVTSVTANSSGVGKVDWSKGDGMSDLTAGSTVTLPSGLLPAGESLVMSEASYTYDSPLDNFIPGLMTFNDKIYLKPRRSTKVLKN